MAETYAIAKCEDAENVINKTFSVIKNVSLNILSGDYKHMHVRFQGQNLYDNSVLRTYNYAYSTSKGLYYFINNLKAYANATYECDLDIDVLTTYQAEILQNTYIIERSEKNFSLYLKDNAYTEYAYKKSENIVFPSGFSSDASTVILTTNAI